MRHFVLKLFLVLLVLGCEKENTIVLEENICDSGTYTGVVVLLTQKEVDSFGALCYSKIDGYLRIGQRWIGSDITDLTPLSNLNEIYTTKNVPQSWNNGTLEIETNSLTSLYGLHNLNSVNGLQIYQCNSLLNLDGLEGLLKIGGANNNKQYLKIVDNKVLQNLGGLENLRSIGQPNDDWSELEISNNYQLQHIDGLQSLTKVFGKKGSQTIISGNSALKNLDGLKSLIHIGAFYTTAQCGSPYIFGFCGNTNLTNLCGLQNLFTNGTYNENAIGINLNAYNPTADDIRDGNCSQ